MRNLISLQENPHTSETLGSHRWMVSYADFITLLFVLFLVLYAKLPKQEEVHIVKKQTATLVSEVIVNKRKAVWDDLKSSLSKLVDNGDVALVTKENGVLLEIRDTALFASGTAKPAEQANGIINKIATVLEKNTNSVVVEGHTDNVPIQTTQYPSNWELSSARAASVVRTLQEYGISANRLAASGLADTKPKSNNDTEEGRSANRRVSLLILDSGVNEK